MSVLPKTFGNTDKMSPGTAEAKRWVGYMSSEKKMDKFLSCQTCSPGGMRVEVSGH